MADGCNHFSFSGASGNFKMSPSLPGPPGPPGKSAYEAAVEGGYTGTEEQFNAALAEVDTALQPSDVDAALSDTSENPVQNKVIAQEIAGQKSALTDLSALVGRKAGMLVDSVSGAIASFVPDATVPNLLGVSVAIEPVQAGSGDPSPDNVRPISGWDSVNVWNKPTHDTSADPTVTIQLGQTVYGAKLTISEDGSVTALIDRMAVTLDGTEVWRKDSTVAGFVRYYIRNDAIKKYTSYIGHMWSNAMETASGYTSFETVTGDFAVTAYSILTVEGNYIYIASRVGSSGEIATVDGLKQWLANHPVQVMYELATPITIQLDPVTIAAIAGQTNNVWADAGDVTVEYAADLKAYIDARVNATRAMIAGIEADMTASRAYTTGDLMIVGDTLYKAAAPIASGAALTPDTNVNATTVAEQLLLLFNS